MLTLLVGFAAILMLTWWWDQVTDAQGCPARHNWHGRCVWPRKHRGLHQGRNGRRWHE